MQATQPTVLWIGDRQHAELRDAATWLARHARLTHVADISQLPADGEFQTVVLAAVRPGIWTQHQVDRLAARYPLAQLVALLGSWCEGEMRTGQPWPGVARVYWHQFTVRGTTQLPWQVPPSSWQLPRTASAVERLLSAVPRPPAGRQGTIGIYSPVASMGEALHLAARRVGYRSVRWPVSAAAQGPGGGESSAALSAVDPSTVDVVIWDAQGPAPVDWTQLQEATRNPTAPPLILMLGFPRIQDVRRAGQAGVAEVISCPFLIEDLWTAVDRVRRIRPHADRADPVPTSHTNR